MAKNDPICAPCALRRGQAALHVGVSASHFDRLVESGVMPSPRLLGGVKVWARTEIEAALLDAPTLDAAPTEADTWADL